MGTPRTTMTRDCRTSNELDLPLMGMLISCNLGVKQQLIEAQLRSSLMGWVGSVGLGVRQNNSERLLDNTLELLQRILDHILRFIRVEPVGRTSWTNTISSDLDFRRAEISQIN